MRLQSFVEDDGQGRRLVWRVNRVVRDGRVIDGRQTSAGPGSGRVPSPGLGLRRRPGWRMPEGPTERRRGVSSVSTAPGGTAGDAGRSRLPPWLARVRPASGLT